ncbi:DUF4367 domain-containing protein [Paenibacillus apiarius]|uniref:DUF4367 domain-containing protein n=1 Tax=Paenibacillus apiarius TaxID=46240 RepID=A0ABT4DXW9_9BACL|nr:DUF4367 domain-containing protein [Paenibacillus apiarius]MCY9517512.1 DUF4367 domain-containing protein [Paenibacillus apiarius]MCY9522209.1 DUF4367 domain-containing protein [Paenibacillus apiarius]MCY9552243.1 DUF4367 domain-containing protein [Paenibacillus apiarius]MCY9560122.1 DUF4367 domain-containing protein [Paenibacillus apiarius]MCY9683740.1 DUF4367 domain-containing protein [Paenibacillus apiarius]
MKNTTKLVIATLSSILLFSSMNLAVEAAPSRAVSELTMKTAAADTKAASEGEKLEKEEQARIAELLEKNPDDTYMVYVSKEVSKRKNAKVYSMGNPFPKFDTYEDYQKKASTLKDTVLQQPADLPEGYQFVTAGIAGPYSTDYTKELEAEAKKLGKKIYSKKINWTRANGIVLEYANGENQLFLEYKRFDPKESADQKGYSYESAEEMKKKYPHLEKEDLKNTLLWFEKGKQFTIVTNPGNPLTKDELIKLAKTMAKK